MAKDLPYFKFFCSEWNDGDITLEDYLTQGVFINICSYYWSNKCDLSYSKMLKKFKDVEPSIIDNLIDSDIIKIEDDLVVINFLIEQLDERDKLSRQNKANAKKRWNEKRKECERNASASIPHSENHAIKKRGEEKREDNIKEIEVDDSENETNQFQEKIKSDLKAIETKNQYSDKDFLENWNELRLKHLKKPSHLNRIGRAEDLEIFEDLKKDYAKEDFKNAMVGLFKQKVMPNGNTTMQSNPSHFLKFFNSYLTAFHDQNDSLYGKVKIESL